MYLEKNHYYTPEEVEEEFYYSGIFRSFAFDLENFGIWIHLGGGEFTLDDVVAYRILCTGELLIKLKDGRTGIYSGSEDGYYNRYDKSNYIFQVPNSIDEASDEEYRRLFGTVLRKHMVNKFILQEELAERTGIPQPRISDYLRGKRLPNPRQLRKIARVLGKTLDEMFYDY